jgi:hypothetical protein
MSTSGCEGALLGALRGSMTVAGLSVAVLALSPLYGCNSDGYADPSRQFAEAVKSDRIYPEVVHEPTSFGVLRAPLIQNAERQIPAETACVACHGVNPDESWEAKPGEEFHTNIEVHHGELTCDHCHSLDRTVLQLADHTPVEFINVIVLCAQCHGPQYRNYLHGAHGGKNGYWDRTRGAQIRNNCVDCHVPHGPIYERVMPVLPPRDRHLPVRKDAGPHTPAEGEHHE